MNVTIGLVHITQGGVPCMRPGARSSLVLLLTHRLHDASLQWWQALTVAAFCICWFIQTMFHRQLTTKTTFLVFHFFSCNFYQNAESEIDWNVLVFKTTECFIYMYCLTFWFDSFLVYLSLNAKSQNLLMARLARKQFVQVPHIGILCAHYRNYHHSKIPWWE